MPNYISEKSDVSNFQEVNQEFLYCKRVVSHSIVCFLVLQRLFKVEISELINGTILHYAGNVVLTF